jgi:hypothetical protein
MTIKKGHLTTSQTRPNEIMQLLRGLKELRWNLDEAMGRTTNFSK